MIIVDDMLQIKKIYGRWLELDPKPFWAIGTQSFPFRHIHVPLINNLTVDMQERIVTVPMPPNYPEGKMNAGVVILKNSMWVICRNFNITMQEFLINYISNYHNQYANVLSKGHSYNENDVLINGKKVLGQIRFQRGGQTYHACVLNFKITEEDREDLIKGMASDRNFYPDKVENISGLINEIPEFNENLFIDELENWFMGSDIPEYKKFEVI